MHAKCDSREIMINNETDEIIEKLFESLEKRYQNNLESMKGSEFVFDYVKLLYYKCPKTNPNCGGPYIDFPNWIKNKKTTINPRKEQQKR